MAENSQTPEEATETVAAQDPAEGEATAATATVDVENSEPVAAAEPATEAAEATPAAETPAEAGESKDGGENFAQMLEDSEKKAAGELKIGDKVSGVIAKIDGENAFVDYGGRGEALIRTSELMGKDGELLLKVGDPIEAFASKVDDEVVLSRGVSRSEGNTDALYQAFKSGMPVEGQVDAVNKWGMGVIFQGGVRGFCPI